MDGLSAWPGVQTWVSATFLLSMRTAGLFLFAAPFSSVSIPPLVRVLIGLALAIVLASALPSAPVPEGVISAGALMASSVSELALGATMALGVNMAFAAFSIGGRLLDVQIGFGIGQVFDPLSQQQVPVLTSAFNQLAVVVFLVSDAHHNVLRGLALSVERFPPGSPWLLQQAAAPLIQQASSMFALGFAMVAPVVFCLFLVEVGLGVVARNLPQMNMFMLAIPVKVVVGLTALSLSVIALSGVIERVNGTIFKTWEAVFR